MTAGTAMHGRISGLEPITLTLTLAAGQYTEIAVEQAGIDLTFSVQGPTGGDSFRVDQLRSARGTEWVPLLTKAAGDYVLRVAAAHPGQHSGEFTVTVAPPVRPHPDQHRTAEAMASVLQGDAMARRGLAEERSAALAAYDRALTLAPPASRVEAIAVARRAQAAERSENVSRTAQAYERAYHLALAAGERIAATLHRIAAADLAGWMGDGTRAQGMAREALAFAEAAHDPIAQGRAMLVLGALAYDRDDYPEGVQLFSRARALFAEACDRGLEGHAIMGLGDALRQRGDLTRAEWLYAEALSLFERVHDLVGEGGALHELGVARSQIHGDGGDAHALFVRAARAFRAAGDRLGLPFTLDSIGLYQRAQGDTASAAATITEALRMRRAVGIPKGEAQSLEALGGVLSLRGEHASALGALREAHAIMRRLGDAPLEARSLYYLARAEAAAGDADSALAHIDDALRITDRRRQAVGAEESRALLAAQSRRFADLRVALLMESGASGDADATRTRPAAHLAFAASEASRARALRERLGLSWPAFMRAPAPLRAEERSARERLRSLEAEYMRRAREGAPLTDLARLDARIVEARTMHEGQFAALSSEVGDEPEPAALFPEDVQPLLADDALLLVYHVGVHGSFVWAVSRDGVASYGLPAAQPLRELAGRVRAEIGARVAEVPGEGYPQRAARIARADAAWEEAAAELSRAVLGPVRELARSRRVLIATDDALQLIPFAALPLPEADESASQTASPRLVSRHEIVIVPSAAALVELARRPHRHALASGRYLVLADAVYGGDDARLPTAPANESTRPRLLFAAREAAHIASLLPRERLTALLGFDASRPRFLEASLAEQAVVHIAAHADIDEDAPFSSAIFVSQLDRDGRAVDGTLHIEDIDALALSAELVVLSACRSAEGREIRGEGVMGMARALLAAGAHRVIASAWPVHDKATAVLMGRFYDALIRRGQDVPAALRTAQAQMAQDPVWGAPYYWAAFSSFGLP